MLCLPSPRPAKIARSLSSIPHSPTTARYVPFTWLHERGSAAALQELGQDLIIQSHLDELNDTLLEQNLLRILEPFSRVEVSDVMCSLHHLALVFDLSLTLSLSMIHTDCTRREDH